MPIQSINQVISQMRILAAQASGDVSSSAATEKSGFNSVLKQVVDNVNDTQMHAGKLKKDFTQGVNDVSLAQVMIASQKSEIAFQGLLQVRNKFMKAYQDIMNMPI